MSKSNYLENALLELLFNGTAISNLADNAGSNPATVLWVSLHTSSPGEAGNQSSNEVSYGTYARVSVARSTAGWTVSGDSVSPAAAVEFSQATSGTATVTHAGIGLASEGAGTLLYHGEVTPNIAITTGVTPRLTTASTITED